VGRAKGSPNHLHARDRIHVARAIFRFSDLWSSPMIESSGGWREAPTSEVAPAHKVTHLTHTDSTATALPTGISKGPTRRQVVR
jgi:hypothetical protein